MDKGRSRFMGHNYQTSLAYRDRIPPGRRKIPRPAARLHDSAVTSLPSGWAMLPRRGPLNNQPSRHRPVLRHLSRGQIPTVTQYPLGHAGRTKSHTYHTEIHNIRDIPKEEKVTRRNIGRMQISGGQMLYGAHPELGSYRRHRALHPVGPDGIVRPRLWPQGNGNAMPPAPDTWDLDGTRRGDDIDPGDGGHPAG